MLQRGPIPKAGVYTCLNLFREQAIIQEANE